MTGRTLQARRLTLWTECAAACAMCRRITPLAGCVIDHYPRPLCEWDHDPLADADWRDHVRLLCVACHDRAHGVRPKRITGIDGWPT